MTFTFISPSWMVFLVVASSVAALASAWFLNTIWSCSFFASMFFWISSLYLKYRISTFSTRIPLPCISASRASHALSAFAVRSGLL